MDIKVDELDAVINNGDIPGEGLGVERLQYWLGQPDVAKLPRTFPAAFLLRRQVQVTEDYALGVRVILCLVYLGFLIR
jgi:hypothetical protein